MGVGSSKRHISKTAGNFAMGVSANEKEQLDATAVRPYTLKRIPQKIAGTEAGGTAEVPYASGWGHMTCWAGEDDSGSAVGVERTGSKIFKPL